MPLLDIRNLTIELMTNNGPLPAVDKVNLSLSEGEIRGLVGESGSGKTLIAKVICGNIDTNWRISADRFRFNNVDLLTLTTKQRRKLIGGKVSMIFQDPQSCLDPAENIGNQIMQAIPRHRFQGHGWQYLYWRKNRMIELLHRVGIKEHQSFMQYYPYELTEGECQKVMIAIALATQPNLLIADEPTNAMEATTQAQIFRLLASLNQNNNTTILLISHDLQIMSKWTDRMSVIYCGQIVEMAETRDILATPYHPYTQALIRSMPNFNQALAHKSRFNTLPGNIPPLDHLPIGCRLGPRCPYAQKKCIHKPTLCANKHHYVACHYPLNQEDTNL